MKKIFISLFILLNFSGFGQELEMTGGINMTIFNNHNFYKESTVYLQPGFDIGAGFAFNRAKTLFTGLNVSYYRGGLQYVSDANIKHLLKRQIWLIKLPIYYRYPTGKFELKAGIVLQYPLSDLYVYNIYDGNRLVYHNTDKPIQYPYKDYVQILLGAEYHLSKRLKFNFQITALNRFESALDLLTLNYLISYNHIHFSTGLIYSINLNDKKQE